jgi:hypothetical protein
MVDQTFYCFLCGLWWFFISIKLENAGSIFIEYTPESASGYASGANHTRYQ